MDIERCVHCADFFFFLKSKNQMTAKSGKTLLYICIFLNRQIQVPMKWDFVV